ncbi:MAG: ribosome small subunit-dependent GTPase A [Candidatus Cryptobacteroides sp.]
MEGTATVVKHTGSHYLLASLPEWKLFPAVLRGNLRLSGSTATNPVAVGDRVEFSADAEITPEHPAVISRIFPRRNYIIRKSVNLSRQAHIIAANLDRAFIIVTLAFPEVKMQFLDRLLVTCELYGVKPVIVLNKCDILDEFPEDFAHLRQRFHEIYEGAGYEILEVSAKTGKGMAQMLDCCTAPAVDGEKPVILFSGVSGVGKSSLIKALDPELNPRTAEISQSHLQGRHTTTFYEMYPLRGGEAFVIDTPGIRGFGLVDVEADEIARYFPEMLSLSRDCRFTPCTHVHEPGCAVKDAVEQGLMSPKRYASYLGMLDEYKKYR